MSDPAHSLTAKRPNGIAMTSLVIGLVSLAAVAVFLFTTVDPWVVYLAGAAGIAAIITGGVALAKKQSRGMAVAGLIIGVIGFLLPVGLLVFALVFIGAIFAG